jgi:hypothetical protein
MRGDDNIMWYIYATDGRVQPAVWRRDDGREPSVQALDVVNLVGATLLKAWRGRRADEPASDAVAPDPSVP